MPITTYPAGTGPAGFAPGADLSDAPATAPAHARRLVAPPLDYELDDKGRWIGADAIEQGAALSLTVRRGTIKSAPAVGHTLAQVKTGLPSTAADVRDRVLTSFPLSRYIAAGDVDVIEITYEEIRHGGLLVQVELRNNRRNVGDPIFRVNNGAR